MSISDLELGTVLALTRKAEPDSETMLDSHIRIGANMAAAQQKPLIVKYRASLSSDKTIAQILQNDENVASHRRCAVFALFRSVSLRFVSFRFVSFCFVTFCFVLFCFVLFCFVCCRLLCLCIQYFFLRLADVFRVRFYSQPIRRWSNRKRVPCSVCQTHVYIADANGQPTVVFDDAIGC